jgi:hypothetical protein
LIILTRQGGIQLTVDFTKGACGFGVGNFCIAKHKEGEAGKVSAHYQSDQGDKLMQYITLVAVVSALGLYVLIIAGCLCYVGRQWRRTS